MTFRSKLTSSIIGLVMVISLIYSLLNLLLYYWGEDELYNSFLESSWSFLSENNLLEQCPCSIDGLGVTYQPIKGAEQLAEGIYEIEEVHLLISSVDGQRWYLWINSNESPLEAAESDIYVVLGSLLLLSIVGAILLSVVISHFLSLPIEKLLKKLSQQPFQKDVALRENIVTSSNEIEYFETLFDESLERINDFIERERAFAESASHELRNPLAVLQANVDLLESLDHSSPRIQVIIARMKRALTAMEEVSHTCLLLSREDEVASRLTNVSLGDFIHKHYSNEINAGQIEFIIKENVIAEVEYGLLEILVSNLLRNAFKHGEGKVKIYLSKRHLMMVNPINFSDNSTTGYSVGQVIVRRISRIFDWQVKFRSSPTKYIVLIKL